MVWGQIAMAAAAAYQSYQASQGGSTTGSGQSIESALMWNRELNRQIQDQYFDALPDYYDAWSAYTPMSAGVLAGTAQGTAEMSPVYRALQARMLDDLGSDAHAEAEGAVRHQLRQALGSRGLLGSASGALTEATGVAQLGEQMRASSIGNAINFLNARPLTMFAGNEFSQQVRAPDPSFYGQGFGGMMGFQSDMFAYGQAVQQQRSQGMSQGIGVGLGALGRWADSGSEE